MTAYAVEERLQEARAANVHAVVHKPFAPPYLLSVLRAALVA
jgi:CheY-like chemotaxis protein